MLDRIKFIWAIKDIYNYIFIIRKVKQLSKTEQWKKFNLRHDWIYRIYTVLNIEVESSPLESTLIEEYEIKYAEQFTEIGAYLATNNLGEVLKPERISVSEVDNIKSTLVIFKPLFYVLNFWYVISRVILLGGLYYLISKYDIFNLLIKFLGDYANKAL